MFLVDVFYGCIETKTEKMKPKLASKIRFGGDASLPVASSSALNEQTAKA